MKTILIILLLYIYFVIAYDFIYLIGQHPPMAGHIYAYTINTIFYTIIWWVLYREAK